MNNKLYGEAGEDIACNYLVKNRYKILARNYVSKLGELDIVAEIDDIIVCVEVKRRFNAKVWSPAAAVDFRKQKHISNAAWTFINQYKLLGKQVRFDIIEVFGNEVNHIQNAFESKVRF